MGVYAQDEWKINDQLTMNGGLRFDQMYQFVVASQLSPRLSLLTAIRKHDMACWLRALFHTASAGGGRAGEYQLVPEHDRRAIPVSR